MILSGITEDTPPLEEPYEGHHILTSKEVDVPSSFHHVLEVSSLLEDLNEANQIILKNLLLSFSPSETLDIFLLIIIFHDLRPFLSFRYIEFFSRYFSLFPFSQFSCFIMKFHPFLFYRLFKMGFLGAAKHKL
jgi:hypothetical protein